MASQTHGYKLGNLLIHPMHQNVFQVLIYLCYSEINWIDRTMSFWKHFMSNIPFGHTTSVAESKRSICMNTQVRPGSSYLLNIYNLGSFFWTSLIISINYDWSYNIIIYISIAGKIISSSYCQVSFCWVRNIAIDLLLKAFRTTMILQDDIYKWIL